MTNKDIKKTVFSIILLTLANITLGQAPDFSQSYTNILYTNPAFAGINNCPQAYTSFRTKYTNIQAGYSTNYLSIDSYIQSIKADIGISLLHDIQNTIFFHTAIHGIIAKEYQIDKKSFFKIGIRSGYIHNYTNHKKLIFSDMLNPLHAEIGETNETFQETNRHLFDIEPGFLVYTENLYGGFTIKHLQEKLINHRKNTPLLHTSLLIHAGGSFSNTKAFTKKHLILLYPHINVTISPTSSYTQLGIVSQKQKIQIGAGYRQNLPWNAESFLLFIGFVEKKFKFAYNCDVSINSHVQKNWNIHEVSFSYNFECVKKRKRYEAVKAPIF